MYSAASSSLSPVTPYQRIDEILMTRADMQGFDLNSFIAHIDALLAHYGRQRRRRNLIPSALEASNFADQVSTNVELIVDEIKENSGNRHEISIAVCRAIGEIHWTAKGFLIVSAVLKVVDTIRNNKECCFRLLKSMNDLAKVIPRLQRLPNLNMELRTILENSINLIVEGAILCCSQWKKKMFIVRFFKASTDKQELQQLKVDIDDMRENLQTEMLTSILVSAQSFLVLCPRPVPNHNRDAGETSSPSIETRRMTCDDQARRSKSSERRTRYDVYLCYSDKQMLFVRQIYRWLINLGLSCFFDECSLPIGSDFSLHKFEAMKTCRIAILLLSREFLESRQAMREASALVEARYTNPSLKILPLFFKMRPKALRKFAANNEMLKRFEKSEERWMDWHQSLNVIRGINGLTCRPGDDEVQFGAEIVNATRSLSQLSTPHSEGDY